MTQLDKTLKAARAIVLGILALGLGGTLVELYLLRHTEGAWELFPLVLVVVAIPVVLWDVVRSSRLSNVVLQLTMALIVIAGGLGVLLHYKANIGYERDSNPGAEAKVVYRKAVQGSTPTLAPGAMVELGLVGLLFAFLQPTRIAGLKAPKGDDS